MLAVTAIVILLRDTIPRAFLGADATTSPGTVELSAWLLLIGSTFFVADAIQGIAAGALRGLNDTRVPLLFAALSFWVIGFTSAYGLAFPAGLGAVGIWIGFSLSVFAYAILLVWRFHRLTAHGQLPRVG
jgi:multidrug resistance protein, MATE family